MRKRRTGCGPARERHDTCGRGTGKRRWGVKTSRKLAARHFVPNGKNYPNYLAFPQSHRVDFRAVVCSTIAFTRRGKVLPNSQSLIPHRRLGLSPRAFRVVGFPSFWSAPFLSSFDLPLRMRGAQCPPPTASLSLASGMSERGTLGPAGPEYSVTMFSEAFDSRRRASLDHFGRRSSVRPLVGAHVRGPRIERWVREFTLVICRSIRLRTICVRRLGSTDKFPTPRSFRTEKRAVVVASLLSRWTAEPTKRLPR